MQGTPAGEPRDAALRTAPLGSREGGQRLDVDPRDRLEDPGGGDDPAGNFAICPWKKPCAVRPQVAERRKGRRDCPPVVSHQQQRAQNRQGENRLVNNLVDSSMSSLHCDARDPCYHAPP